MESASIVRVGSDGKKHTSRAKSKIKGLVMNDEIEKLASASRLSPTEIRKNPALRTLAVGQGLLRIEEIDKESITNQQVTLTTSSD